MAFVLLAGLALTILIPIVDPGLFGGPYAAAATDIFGLLGALLLVWKLSPRLFALLRRFLQRDRTP